MFTIGRFKAMVYNIDQLQNSNMNATQNKKKKKRAIFGYTIQQQSFIELINGKKEEKVSESAR